MSDRKDIYFSLFDKLTPTAKSKEEVTLKQIDEAPEPSLQETEKKTELDTQIKNRSFEPEELFVDAFSVSQTPYQRVANNPLDSMYVSKEGVKKEGIVRAVKDAARVSRSVPFESFNRSHLNACRGLIDVLYYIHIENLQRAIDYIKPLVNEELLNYCISVVARHRPDFIRNNIQLPSHITNHPSNYVDVSKVDSMLISRELSDQTEADSIEIYAYHDFTATDVDPEHFIAYFREDIGVNLHHRHWHEVYPTTGPEVIVNKDRRGELFVYMHGQILARYNFERLCSGLRPVKKFSNFNEHIQEAYYPKLDEASKLKIWSPRQPNAQLSDVDREGVNVELIDLERWLERIIEVIDREYAVKKLANGIEGVVRLEEPQAINDLGNTIDSAPDLSYNSRFYGDLHTSGHFLIAYCHDPDKRYKEQNGVMGRLEAALRDPIFYRWHAFIDDVIERYRRNLTPYPLEKRQFQGIEIESVVIQSEGTNMSTNVITTFWQNDRVDVTDGILSLNEHPELKKKPKVFVKFTHLQHDDFEYKFVVNNNGSKPVTGVARIFMAPKYDESRQKMKFNKLRRFMIELDKFTVSLTKGRNEFSRKSTCSSVTVPFEQTFMTKDQAKAYSKDDKTGNDALSYCGCGWPHHMLIGKGRKSGFPCTLFVMITNYDEDKVNTSEIESCGNSSISYCGVRDKKYPDKRPMGFPFDRPITDSEADLATFMTKTQFTHDKNSETVKNMFQTDFKIEFNDKTVDGSTIVQPSKKTS